MINIGYMAGHISEFLLFLYFANTTLYPRIGYAKSGLAALCGYGVLCAAGMIGSAQISIAAFFVVNTFLLACCYDVKLKNAMFYSFALDAMSCIGEYAIVYMLGIRYNGQIWNVWRDEQFLAVSLGGKLIYLVGIIFMKHAVGKKLMRVQENELTLVLIPLLTIVCLTEILRVEMQYYIFLLICIAFFAINILVFYFGAMLSEKNASLRNLQEEYSKLRNELSEYQLLSEKYENTRIMRHDFHKQLEVLKELIAEDNVRAKEYMQEIRFFQREQDYTRYTDNKILNILCAQKVEEAHKRGVEIHIHSTFPPLSFISDMDTVAIFSNMLDNAIEAAENAERKEIYMDLYTVNDAYSAVRVENYCQKAPVVLEGALRTQKKDADMHGIGTKSINSALKRYGSELEWSYDRNNKIFRATVILRIPGKRNNI